MTSNSSHLFEAAWSRVATSHRPSTLAAQHLHFRTFLSFLTFLQLPVSISVHNLLIFLEYLYNNSLSPKVIKNYLASISTMAFHYNLDPTPIKHQSVTKYLRSITINSPFSPTPRGVFAIQMLYQISLACDLLPDPILYRGTFLTAYFAFLRMSNIAPHRIATFDPNKHLLRKDVVFGPPGAHIIIKWTKTLQDSKAHHVVPIPSLPNIYLCPVRAISRLLESRPLPPSFPTIICQHIATPSTDH